MNSGNFFKEILVVDDEAGIRKALGMHLAKADYHVGSASDGLEALEYLHTHQVDMVLTDVRMPGMTGLDLLERIKEEGFDTTVIVMSAFGTFDSTIEAMRKGAYDYIHKPIVREELLLVIRKAEERERLRRENLDLKRRIAMGRREVTIISDHPRMHALFAVVRKVAAYKSTVLIMGESGTGKELIARTIHENSERRDKPFVAVNCGAIPPTLIESELFGYVKGAFTDAYRDKLGLFEQAHAGTLFLDEINELPLSLQVKLLRVLQEEEIRRVGGANDIKVDVRILVATSKDLPGLVKEGKFREDLYYRLNVITVHLPPLRERREDIPLLAEHFRKQFNLKLGTTIRGVTEGALEALTGYDWPGNVRELENTIERAIILTDSEEIGIDDLPAKLRGEKRGRVETFTLPEDDLSIKRASAILEKELITKALRRTQGNRTAASRILDISHRALLYKIKEYGIEL